MTKLLLYIITALVGIVYGGYKAREIRVLRKSGLVNEGRMPDDIEKVSHKENDIDSEISEMDKLWKLRNAMKIYNDDIFLFDHIMKSKNEQHTRKENINGDGN